MSWSDAPTSPTGSTRRIKTSLRPSSPAIFASRHLDAWLDHFGDEDVCVGPVWTRDEAALAFGSADTPVEVPLGAHTEAWRRELGLSGS